jgi:hypothetical protein
MMSFKFNTAEIIKNSRSIVASPVPVFACARETAAQATIISRPDVADFKSFSRDAKACRAVRFFRPRLLRSINGKLISFLF